MREIETLEVGKFFFKKNAHVSFYNGKNPGIGEKDLVMLK